MADFGLQCFDSAGLKTLDVDTALGVFLGYIDTNGQLSGTVTDSRLLNHRLVWTIQRNNSGSVYNNVDITGPVCTKAVNSGSFSWGYYMTWTPLQGQSGFTQANICQHRIWWGIM